ncbi:FGGY-family carbohydrate kinase [Roseiarcus sp.]|uniref:FGGY-family carbohydrate kinase n=1 Tax=Roseiarcus sp. TaxID=1969460 RepID=UPI003C73CBEF
MTAIVPRGIAVVDIGATNSKVVLFDSSLAEIARRKTDTVHHDGPPYRHIDAQRIVEFAVGAISELDRALPVDVIVVSAFGSTLACVDDNGELATPVMDYLAEPPAEIAESYAKIAPPFSETFCNTWPAALSLGRQLYWLETAFPGAFARVRSIMTWSQYLAFRLGGRQTCEISTLGAFSQLLDVLNRDFSSLVQQRGWADRFAPLTRAWEDIGELKEGLRPAAFSGRGRILCGVHDSDANYLRYLAAGFSELALLSTGTFIVGFESQTDIHRLDPSRETFSYTSVFGRPIGCCGFFGGREFDKLLAGASPSAATTADIETIIAQAVFALPSFSDAGGPVAGSGNRGRIEGPVTGSPGRRAALATLYAALMTSEALDAVGSRSPIVIDGPFSRNALFCSLLASLRPRQRVASSLLQEGTAAGAAVLALMNPAGDLPKFEVELRPHEPEGFLGLGAYQSAWRAKARADATTGACLVDQ